MFEFDLLTKSLGTVDWVDFYVSPLHVCDIVVIAHNFVGFYDFTKLFQSRNHEN